MRPKRALICGISGQDGAYLSELLLSNGYRVVGTSRSPRDTSLKNLAELGIEKNVSIRKMLPEDSKNVLDVVSEYDYDEIYNLAGQTSVALSFEHPVNTMASISIGTLNVLEALRRSKRDTRFFNSGSSECFGDTGHSPADELTPFKPKSPYAIAKSAACWQVSNYRAAYNLFVCNGLMFNHESPFRPTHFVTRKIVTTVCAIYRGSKIRLELGNIDVDRDWGWAPEYCDAMWRMLQHDSPGDFVIATGQTNSLRNFIHETFAELELNWEQHVELKQSLFRPADIKRGMANPQKANDILGWRAEYKMRDVIKKLIQHELQSHCF